MANGNQTSQIQGWALPQQQPGLPPGITQRQLTDYQRGLTQNMPPSMQDRIRNFIDQRNTTPAVTNISGRDTPFVPVPEQLNTVANQFQGSLPGVANQIRALQNEYGNNMNAYDKVANLYGAFEGAMDPLYQTFTNASMNLGGSVANQLLANRENFMNQYGPQGEQRRRLDEYYMNLGNYLSSAAADDLAMMEAQGVQSGASFGAQRAGRNQAMQQNLQRFVEAKQREVADYDNLYKTLNQYEQEFIRQYADSNDRFIIDAYRNLVNYKNTIGQNLLNAQQELIIAGGVGSGGGLGGGSGGGTGAGGGAGTGTDTGTGTTSGTTTGTGTAGGTGTGTGGGTVGGTTGGTGSTLPITNVRRLTPQEEMMLNSPFIGDPNNMPATMTTRQQTPVDTGGRGGVTVGGLPLMPGRIYDEATGGLVGVATRQPDVASRMTALGPVSQAVPTRPTIVPTPRQMQDYDRGLTANMSTALIKAIQYYRANPQQYATAYQSTATPRQVTQANVNAVQPLIQAGANTGLIRPTAVTPMNVSPARQQTFVQPLTPQQQMNLLGPRL